MRATEIARCLIVLFVLLLLVPTAALAQAATPGIVTAVQGVVTAKRRALPHPVLLKSNDHVFLQDTITTGDKSRARLLVGGRVLVIVHERSELTITGLPDGPSIDLATGKLGIALAGDRVPPGTEIEIGTPNAIARLSDASVIGEVSHPGAQAATTFYVLRGSITARPSDPATRQPLGTPIQVERLHAYSRVGASAPQVKSVTVEEAERIISGGAP